MDDRFRDFDAFEAEHQAAPLTFQLGGREWHASRVSAPAFLTLARRLQAGGNGSSIAVLQLVQGMVDEKEQEAFEEMLTTARPRLATFVALVQWMIEQDTNAPLVEASTSPSGPRRRGGKSKVVSLSPGSTSRRSRSAAG